MHTNKPFAEVIESSLHSMCAQSWEWDYFPTFGSLVSIENNQRTVFAIVHQIQTGSMDPSRYPFAYKKTEEELMREQPQIFEFLKTTFTCLTLGYKEKGRIQYLLSPQPPKIHAFVTHTSPELSKEFFSRHDYVHLLFGMNSELINLDELLLALLQYQQSLGLLHEKKIKKFIEVYSLLTGNDYRRIKLLLQRVQPLLKK